MDTGHWVAVAVAGLAAIVSVSATALAFAGVLPWPSLTILYGTSEIVWFGQALQIGVTLLLVVLAMSLPGIGRVLRLEATHRRFEIDMDDITKAYRAAHMADRAEIFGMQREFDAVRERYRYLKGQPGLNQIDAELLTVAAQMSQQTQELASVYSDEKVARARESLKQRHKDAETLQDRLQNAYASIREIRRMMDDVDIEESTVASQIARLREEMVDFENFRPEPTAGKGKVPHLKTV